MVKRTIDLRNRGSVRREDVVTEQEDSGFQKQMIIPRGKTLIEWSAPEYEPKEYGTRRFLLIGAAATLLIILGILIRSYFFIAFVVLAVIVLTLYVKRKPSTLSFSISDEGISAGNSLYSYSDLKSFWILERGSEHTLSLETTRGFLPFIHIPLGEISTEEIRGALENFIPEEEHKELITDQIARVLGL